MEKAYLFSKMHSLIMSEARNILSKRAKTTLTATAIIDSILHSREPHQADAAWTPRWLIGYDTDTDGKWQKTMRLTSKARKAKT